MAGRAWCCSPSIVPWFAAIYAEGSAVNVSLIDERTGVSIPVAVLLPEGARDSSPLVVISHGNGGSGSIYRVLAGHLARAGFIVALLDHPGNTRGDNDLARTLANLERRLESVCAAPAAGHRRARGPFPRRLYRARRSGRAAHRNAP
jgi:predicted dienelactone hydrolase